MLTRSRQVEQSSHHRENKRLPADAPFPAQDSTIRGRSVLGKQQPLSQPPNRCHPLPPSAATSSRLVPWNPPGAAPTSAPMGYSSPCCLRASSRWYTLTAVGPYTCRRKKARQREGGCAPRVWGKWVHGGADNVGCCQWLPVACSRLGGQSALRMGGEPH